MTAPGAGQNINLAALWIPVMPETSHMGEEMKKAGAEAKTKFEEGFNSSGNSPEAIGESFSSKLNKSMANGLKNFELPFGLSGAFERMGGEVDKTTSKLQGEAKSALQAYTAEYEKMGQAQQKAAEADANISNMRKAAYQGLNEAQQQHLVGIYGEEQAYEHAGVKASALLPLLGQQEAAHARLAEQTTKTGAAYENYSSKATSAGEATREVAGHGNLLAGIMGGVMVAGINAVTTGIAEFGEKFIEFGVETFKEGVEVAHEFVEAMIEVGESYEKVEIQTTEFSAATGEKFEELTSHAQQVFSSLDVAGENTGRTMAQFASMLDAEPGVALDNLTKHVEELKGRFTTLNPQILAQSFAAFKVPVDEADSALASLLQSARGSGQDLGQLTQALSGTAALTLKEAGLNIEQAGKVTADLLKLGDPGRQAMTGFASAMKEFGKEGLSFSDGMKLAGERLKDLGDTAEGQDLAEKLFGTRNWVVAKQAVGEYLDVVEQGPDAFNASGESLDEFLEKTRNLSNEWEEVKHKAMSAFEPMGAAALKVVGTGLDNLSTYVSTHMDQVRDTIKHAGTFLVGFTVDVMKFGEGVLRFFAPIVNVIDTTMATAISSVAMFGHVTGEMMSNIPGLEDMGNGLITASDEANKFAINLGKLNVGDKMTKLADWTHDHIKDVEAAGDSWPAFADKVADALDAAGDKTSWFSSQAAGIGAPAGGSVGLGTGLSAGPAVGGGGGGSASASGTMTTENVSQKDAATQIFSAVKGAGYSDQTAIAAVAAAMHESSLNPNIDNTEKGIHHGLFQESSDKPSGTMSDQIQWFVGALAAAGGPRVVDKNPANTIADKVEIGGYSGSVYDLAGARAILGMAGGGSPTPSMGRMITSGKGGGDDVAALLKRGEYVWDTDTMDKFGWLITALHQGTTGFGQGGDVGGVSQVIWSNLEDPTVQAAHGDAGMGVLHGSVVSGGPGSAYSDETNSGGQGFAGHHGHVHTTFNRDPFSGAPYGIPDQDTAAGEWSAFPPWVKQLGDMYGLDAKTYKGHQVWDGLNHGIDWWPRGKQDMSGQSYTAQDDSMLTNFASAAIAVGSGQMQGFTGGLGASTLGPAVGGPGSTPGGRNGGLYQGMSGQYGGSGVYGGETADQVFSTAQAVQDARDRASDLDTDIAKQQRRIQDIRDQLAAPPGDGKTDLLTGKPTALTPAEVAADTAKRKSLNEQLDDATTALAKSQRERAEQDGKISNAERKQQEAQFKKPTGTTGSGGDKNAQTLGSGLLQGIGQELGLGDVFGKSPLDWGIVKLAEGLFNYGNNLGDSFFGKSGGLGGPGGSGGLTQGVGTGLLGSLGIKLPSAAISGATNVVPGDPASGIGTGPLPGPVNIDQSINVSPNVDPSAILGPVNNLQRDQSSQNNATSFTHTGGFPQP